MLDYIHNNAMGLIIITMTTGLIGACYCLVMAIYHSIQIDKKRREEEKNKINKLLLWMSSFVPYSEYEEYVDELFQGGQQEKRGLIEIVTGKEYEVKQ